MTWEGGSGTDALADAGRTNPGRKWLEVVVERLVGVSLGELHPVYETNRRDFPTSFYSLRILTILEEQYDHPYGLAETGVDEGWWDRDSDSYELMVNRMKCTWFSHRDLGQLVSLCLEDESVDFDVFWGVSGNEASWVDLDHTRDVLGYEPEDDGSKWDAPPE